MLTRSILVDHQAAATAALYVRCTAVDPSDRTNAKKMKRRRQLARGGGGGRLPRLRYGYILWRYAVRLLRRVEARVMNRWVRRSYLEQWNSSVQLDPMLPFAFTSLDDIVSPHPAEGQDISFCPVCDCEVPGSIPLQCTLLILLRLFLQRNQEISYKKNQEM